MTSPAQLEIGYHPTFASSFWTYPDYRTGATVLYTHIQDGLDENDEVLALFKHRAEVEREAARLLGHIPEPVHTSNPLFSGASSSARGGIQSNATPSARALRLLVSEFATSQADSRLRAAKQMEATIVRPFSDWVIAHAERVQESYDKVDEALSAMEKQDAEVTRLRTAYETKCRLADEAEDDARFAPGAHTSATPPHAVDDVTSSTRRLSLSPRKEEGGAESEAPLNPHRLQRRETLRQQFGFKQRRADDASEKPAAPAESEAPAPAPGLQRSSSRLSTYLTRAVGKMGESPTLAQVRAAVSGLADPRHVRLRRDAEVAEQLYQEAVAQLDALRCRAEQVLFHQYHNLQRWESDRVTALQRVVHAYNRAMAPEEEDGKASMERTALLAARLQPTTHVQFLMNEYKTGPFRPASVVFHPYYHDDLNAVAGVARAGFGMDLVSTAKGTALAAQESQQQTGQPGSVLAMPTLPPVLHALLSALQRSYADRARWIPSGATEAPAAVIHAEKRRIWLYDVPLHVTHALRARLIAHASAQGAQSELGADELLDTIDAPVLAATVKLWALELDTPLLPYSFWDEIAEIYDAADIRFEAQRAQPDADPALISTPIIQGLHSVLARLPKLHLACLDAWIAHLYKLIKDTPTDEDPHIYTAKLGLSLGRSILRPSADRPSTVYAKYPTLLVKDFVEHYEELFPPLMHAKAKESDMKALSPFRNVPIRRRASLVDQRISRSSLQSTDVPTDGLRRRAAQYEQLHGARSPLRRHSSLSYRPTQGAERAARTSRNFSAHASLQEVPSVPEAPSESPTDPAPPVVPPSTEAPAAMPHDTAAPANEVPTTQPSLVSDGKHEAAPAPASPLAAPSPGPAPAPAPAPEAPVPAPSAEASAHTSPEMTQAPRFHAAKIDSHKPELIKPKAHTPPPAAAPRESRRLPKLPVPPAAEAAAETAPPLAAEHAELPVKTASLKRSGASASMSSSVRGPRGPRSAGLK